MNNSIENGYRNDRADSSASSDSESAHLNLVSLFEETTTSRSSDKSKVEPAGSPGPEGDSRTPSSRAAESASQTDSDASSQRVNRDEAETAESDGKRDSIDSQKANGEETIGSTDKTEESAEKKREAEDFFHGQELKAWDKLLEEAEIPEGPYRELYKEFGRQLITGNLDKAKLQELMKEAGKLDFETHFEAFKASEQLNRLLEKQGIRIHLGSGGSDISITQPVAKGEWTHRYSIDKEGKEDATKLKFLSPDAPFPDTFKREVGEVTPPEAFKVLREKLRGILEG